MQHNIKFKSIRAFQLQAKNFAENFKMSTATDRQVFGKSLDYA